MINLKEYNEDITLISDKLSMADIGCDFSVHSQYLIYLLWSEFSDEEYSAQWMEINEETIPRFIDWLVDKNIAEKYEEGT